MEPEVQGRFDKLEQKLSVSNSLVGVSLSCVSTNFISRNIHNICCVYFSQSLSYFVCQTLKNGDDCIYRSEVVCLVHIFICVCFFLITAIL